MIVTLYEFLEKLNASKTMDEAWQLANRFFKQFGVDWAIYAYAGPPTSPDEPVTIAPPLSTYPKVWMEHYMRENYASRDFTARHCALHLTPIRMGIDLAPRDLPAPMRQVVREGLDGYGHRSGIVIPTRWSGFHGIGGIGLASRLPGAEFEKILAEHETLLYAVAQALHARLRILEVRKKADRRRLQPRERDLLMLAAQGYENQEIADALGISLSNVKRAFANISTLLGVHNRTHAVVLALQEGLIELE